MEKGISDLMNAQTPPPYKCITSGLIFHTVEQGRIFIFFHRRGEKILGGIASHMQYAILDASGGALNGKPK